MSSMEPTPWVTIGRVHRPVGLRGEFSVSSSQHAFQVPDFRYTRVFLSTAGNPPQGPYFVECARVYRRGYALMLRGISSVDDVTPWRGSLVHVYRDDIPLEDDEYLVADLMGCTAYDHSSGNVLGTVMRCDAVGPGADVVRIRPTGSSESVLLPFRREVFPKVDIPSKSVYVQDFSDYTL